jgi:G3E family GTPase
MRIHLLSGFLGSGKTTAMHQASMALLQEGRKVGVITNDQGSVLVDGGFFRYRPVPERQVVNGCFCCNYGQLDAGIHALITQEHTDIIFAESVGSCTDMVSTVLKPLLQLRPGTAVTLSAFADIRLLQLVLQNRAGMLDKTVRYIFSKQLEEAGIIVVNKIDLAGDQQLQWVKSFMEEKYPDAIILYQQALNKAGLQQWLDTIDVYNNAGSPRSLQVDYDIYAAGEAKMAWVDQSITISTIHNNAMEVVSQLVNRLYELVKQARYAIGHMKFLVNQSTKISCTFLDGPDIALPAFAADAASLLINLRVQAMPEAIQALLDKAITEISSSAGCDISVQHRAALQPGYPRPLHRL